MNPKAERPPWAPTATITTPGGRQLVACLRCGDTLRTGYPALACHFRDWHLTTHVPRKRGW